MRAREGEEERGRATERQREGDGEGKRKTGKERERERERWRQREGGKKRHSGERKVGYMINGKVMQYTKISCMYPLLFIL